MANWAYVEDGIIKETHYSLPQSWRNISNFFALENEPEILKSYGWVRVIDETEPHDPTRVLIDETTYTIDYARDVVIQKTFFTIKSEPNTNIRKEIFIATLRTLRNNKLAESDWSQLIDIQQLKSEEWKQAWFNYRQFLRDLPEVYMNYPYESVVDIEEVVWPEQPSR